MGCVSFFVDSFLVYPVSSFHSELMIDRSVCVCVDELINRTVFLSHFLDYCQHFIKMQTMWTMWKVVKNLCLLFVLDWLEHWGWGGSLVTCFYLQHCLHWLHSCTAFLWVVWLCGLKGNVTNEGHWKAIVVCGSAGPDAVVLTGFCPWLSHLSLAQSEPSSDSSSWTRPSWLRCGPRPADYWATAPTFPLLDGKASGSFTVG